MGHLLTSLPGPGLAGSATVRLAALVGCVVAVTSAVVGVFTVVRAQSFAGHALADVATAGGAGAFLAGLNQFWGFVAFGVTAAALIEVTGAQRQRDRDVTTGVVLGAALGLAALFLYLGSTTTSAAGASFTVLFGSMFAITPPVAAVLAVSAVAVLTVTAVLSRALLLTSLSPDIARARGVRVRAVGAAHLMSVALAVAMCAMAVGAVLSTALLIGPAATAVRLVKGPVAAMATAAALGVAATWAGIVLAYDSYQWPPAGHGWPVSFFIVAVILAGYLLTYLRLPGGRGHRRPPGGRRGAGAG